LVSIEDSLLGVSVFIFFGIQVGLVRA